MSKVLPHDLQAEQAIIAACLLDPNIISGVQTIIAPGDLYNTAHATLLDGLFALGESADYVTLGAWLDKNGHLDKSVKQANLAKFIDTPISTSAGWRYHAEIVRDMAARRRIIGFSTIAADKATITTNDQEEILSELKTAIIALQSEKEPDYMPPSECVRDVFRSLEKRAETGNHDLGLTTGLHNIDLFCNLEPRQTYYLKAKSRSGKSALALQISDQILNKYHAGTGLYFTLESDRQALTFRRMSRLSQIALTRLLKGEIRGEWEWERLTKVAGQLSETKLIVLDQSKFSSIERIVSFCQTFRLNNQILFIVIDFLQILDARGKFQNKHDKYGHISEKLNYLAKDMDCPIMILSQVNAEMRAKESGDIENNAGHVWLLERESEENKGRLIGEKGKNIGTWGPVWLSFDRFTQTFSDFEGD